jgi:hypothetical protein
MDYEEEGRRAHCEAVTEMNQLRSLLSLCL